MPAEGFQLIGCERYPFLWLKLDLFNDSARIPDKVCVINAPGEEGVENPADVVQIGIGAMALILTVEQIHPDVVGIDGLYRFLCQREEIDQPEAVNLKGAVTEISNSFACDEKLDRFRDAVRGDQLYGFPDNIVIR